MRYIVVGDTAILASRGITYIGAEAISLKIERVPDGATLTLIDPDGAQKTTGGVVSGITKIPTAYFTKAGRYAVSVSWKAVVNGEDKSYSATGTSLLVSNTPEGLAITPAPLTPANEMENMWRGIINALDVLLPYFDTQKHGADVI